VDWKDFFKLSVMKEGPSGHHPYFHSELKVSEDFSMDELLMKEFDYLHLNEIEKKQFSLQHRKIFLRHHYFNGVEFERIVENFVERLIHEKEQTLTFSTKGGGVYLFLALARRHEELLQEKKLICYTSEMPLMVAFPKEHNLQFILVSDNGSFFKNIPTLWQNSGP
jgi:hypothetical protein